MKRKVKKMMRYNVANILYHDRPEFPDLPICEMTMTTDDDEGNDKERRTIY